MDLNPSHLPASWSSIAAGRSAGGLDIGGHLIPSSKSSQWLLFLAGVHGDEIEGVWAVEHALDSLQTQYNDANLPPLGLVIFPSFNIDGVKGGTRLNGHSVDLNRNLPTRDWTAQILNPRYPPGPSAASEPENQLLVQLIDRFKPTAILSMHSFRDPQVNINGPEELCRPWGEKLSKLCGYRVTRDIGYPTPGSLGTYSGTERGIPTITLEILRGLAQHEVTRIASPLIQATIDHWASH